MTRPYPVPEARPKRIQLSRAKGWRLPPNTVKVDRTTVFGNPWSVRDARACGYHGTDTALASWCVSLFREWITRQRGSLTPMLENSDAKLAKIEERMPLLRGKNLACWCKPGEPCHADVLLEIANAVPETGDV